MSSSISSRVSTRSGSSAAVSPGRRTCRRRRRPWPPANPRARSRASAAGCSSSRRSRSPCCRRRRATRTRPSPLLRTRRAPARGCGRAFSDTRRHGPGHVDVDAQQPRRRLHRHHFRDDRAPVAALRHVARVSEALHELVPRTARSVGVPSSCPGACPRSRSPECVGSTRSKASSARPP